MEYLCKRCCAKFNIEAINDADNFCNRKSCFGCGDTSDWRLTIINDTTALDIEESQNENQTRE